MSSRYVRHVKKIEVYNANIDAPVERIRKMRALNCNPSSLGADSNLMKKFILATLRLRS